MALTQYELNNAYDPTSVSNELNVAAACHPFAGVIVVYIKSMGILKILCKHCTEFVCDIAVAQGMMKVNTGEMIDADISNNK